MNSTVHLALQVMHFGVIVLFVRKCLMQWLHVSTSQVGQAMRIRVRLLNGSTQMLHSVVVMSVTEKKCYREYWGIHDISLQKMCVSSFFQMKTLFYDHCGIHVILSQKMRVSSVFQVKDIQILRYDVHTSLDWCKGHDWRFWKSNVDNVTFSFFSKTARVCLNWWIICLIYVNRVQCIQEPIWWTNAPRTGCHWILENELNHR